VSGQGPTQEQPKTSIDGDESTPKVENLNSESHSRFCICLVGGYIRTLDGSSYQKTERPACRRLMGGDIQPPAVTVLTPATMPDCPAFHSSRHVVIALGARVIVAILIESGDCFTMIRLRDGVG